VTTIETTTRAELLAERRRIPTTSRPVETPSFDFDVAIVGLGYVGLPTALAYHHGGSRVLAIDISPRRLEVITSRNADLVPRDKERLETALADPSFLLSADSSLIRRAAAVIVCVPTPVDPYLVPDLTLLRSACAMVVGEAVAGQLVMLTSTTYVGCTNDFLVEPLTSRGFDVGEDMFVAFSAERIDPGSELLEQEQVPRVVGGATEECERRAEVLLHRYAKSVHRVRSLGAAEMTKLLENTFRAVNIALANEFADICRGLGLDVVDVIDAASTKPYGFMAFMPGPGVGGHCIPCDPHYLLWQLRKSRVDAPMISEAMNQIAARPARVVDRIRHLLSDHGIPLTGARVLVVGVSYKPDVADLRESPALEILSRLADEGAEVAFSDPFVPSIVLDNGRVLVRENEPGSFGARLVLLHTRHRGADLSWIEPDQLVLDATYRGTEIPQRVTL
jgi:nucleotide sugar dehydrogenase